MCVPTIHISQVQPSLNTIQHIHIYNEHILYIHYATFLLISLLCFWAGRLALNFHVGNTYYGLNSIVNLS
jgi:hypothetical protein